jgi:hypothetical protein
VSSAAAKILWVVQKIRFGRCLILRAATSQFRGPSPDPSSAKTLAPSPASACPIPLTWHYQLGWGAAPSNRGGDLQSDGDRTSIRVAACALEAQVFVGCRCCLAVVARSIQRCSHITCQ